MTNLERLGELLGIETNSDDMTRCTGLTCPEEYKDKMCYGCPYEHFWESEYNGWDGEK